MERTRAERPSLLPAGGLLALCVVALYGRTLGHAFVEFDDPLYVSRNGWVAQGLSWESLRWAFTNDHAFVWHPLTWVSYLVEAEIFGVERAGPFLATNLLLHALASVGLLVAWTRMTGRPTASLALAALFALHPIQVESVAWVSARKEVLAGAFFVATLLAWEAYARRESAGRYAWVCVLAALCLLAKGTLLALPFVLLLLDFWPLRRTRPLRRLLLEKLPLLLLSLADLAVQLRIEARSEALTGADPALPARIPVAVMGFADALRRCFWPVDLSIVHPTPEQMGLPAYGAGPVTAVLALLLAASAAALWLWRRAPFVTVGWLWFALLIAPMTGLAPTGLRVMHDRYAYVPVIGLALLVVWGAAAAARAAPGPWRRLPGTLVVLALAACAVLSWRQVDVWRDSFALFDHALAVEERNAAVWFSRGTAWARAGDVPRAIADLERAVAIRPDHADAHVSLGWLRLSQGDAEGALAHLRRGVALRPGWPLAHINLGHALEARGDAEAALRRFERATEVGPASADAHYWLGVALERRGRASEARLHYLRALALDPAHRWSRDALARLSAEGAGDGGPGSGP